MTSAICSAKKLYLGNVLQDARCEVFIINLDRRPDRFEQIMQHLKEQNCLNVHRIEAIDGLRESPELSKKVVRLNSEYPDIKDPTRRQQGVLGCLKSHLKALQQASQYFGNQDKALILEDDCFFIEEAASILKKSFDQLPSDWLFLMLGAVYGTAPGYVSQKNSLMRVYKASAAHAYIVNTHSCRLLINRIEGLLRARLIIPIDELFQKYQPIEMWYAAHPLIAGQHSGDFSDIDGAIRVHTKECFKLGVTINWKVWLWMKIRPHLGMEIAKVVINRFVSILQWETPKHTS